MRWIDISMTIRRGMLRWPGDEEVAVERVMDLARGDPYNLSRMVMGLHAGTHVDAPLHFLPGGMGAEEIAPSSLIGPARVLEIEGVFAIGREELNPWGISEGERILLKTENSARAWEEEPFRKDCVALTLEGAEYLAGKRVALVGIDYLSIAPWDESAADIHRALLEAGTVILEGLVLSGVAPGSYELACLPLKVANGDGAPARAMLRPLP